MKKIWLLAAVFLFTLTACSAPQAATPSAEPVDINATIEAKVAEAFAQTLTAQALSAPSLTATSTTQPPSETPSPAPETQTPVPSLIPTETLTETPQSSPTAFQGTLAVGGLPNDDRVAWIVVSNESDYKDATITLNGVSENGNHPFYLAYEMTRILRFSVPWGTYKYYITIGGGKKGFSGEFRVNNWDKTTIVIRNDKVIVRGP